MAFRIFKIFCSLIFFFYPIYCRGNSNSENYICMRRIEKVKNSFSFNFPILCLNYFVWINNDRYGLVPTHFVCKKHLKLYTTYKYVKNKLYDHHELLWHILHFSKHSLKAIQYIWKCKALWNIILLAEPPGIARSHQELVRNAKLMHKSVSLVTLSFK